MKILCFHPALAPYRVDFFNLLADKVELKILFLQDNLFSQKFDQAALKRKLKCSYGSLTRGFDIRNRCIRFGVLQAVRAISPDVVLAYEASPVTLALIMFRKFHLMKANIWTFMDDSPDQVRSRTGLRRIIRDWVVNNTNRILVPSAQAAAAYPYSKLPCSSLPNSSTFPLSRFSVVPIIHDTEAIRVNADKVFEMGREWRRTNVPHGWNKVLLFVGRFAAIKNIPWLIDRMSELPVDVGLVLVGDGGEKDVLKERVASVGLASRVLFAGRKEGDELYAMMSMADGLVLCSHSEPFGAVVAEALQWGAPCVVSDNCGAAVLIENGVNGWVFPYGDRKAFIKVIDNLPRKTGESLLAESLKDAVSSLFK